MNPINLEPTFFRFQDGYGFWTLLAFFIDLSANKISINLIILV